jgi:multisubunit Na+/H+ antiporter MnhB subunit
VTDEWLIFDLLLVGTIVWIAWAALAARDQFAGIVLFMVLGLVVALAWARLDAPDVALAEAAVGAGITGALFLRTWAAMRAGPAVAEPTPSPALRLVAAGASLALSALMAVVLLALPHPRPGLEVSVGARIGESGVENPVTAVLLNFRAYDTLLEVLVLFAAAMLVWFVGAAPRGRAAAMGPVFLGFVRFGLPTMIVVAAYLLWTGAFAPGGAFQAGAVLGAAGVLLLLSGVWRPGPRDRGRARAALALGIAAFGGAGVLSWALGGAALQYPGETAKTWIVVIEATIMLATAATLAGLFLGARPGSRT